jgi:hypothetical protein
LSDLNLIEFFQVITDGRKTSDPFSHEEALTYIKKLVEVPVEHILKTQTLAELLAIEKIYEEMIKPGIRRFQIYDYLIADCMRKIRSKRLSPAMKAISGNLNLSKLLTLLSLSPHTPDPLPHVDCKQNPVNAEG